jgi:hypothetical protein
MAFANFRSSITSTRRFPFSSRAIHVVETSSRWATWYCCNPLRFRSRTKYLINRSWCLSSVVLLIISPKAIVFEHRILPITDADPQPENRTFTTDKPLIMEAF